MLWPSGAAQRFESGDVLLIEQAQPITDEMIQRARVRMLEAIDSSERVREAVAASVLDDLALTRAIREKVVMALDVLDVSDSDRAREAARALAQLAAAVKATQSVGRIAFGEDHCESPTKPTVLEIREMTQDEVEAIRLLQSRSLRQNDNDDDEQMA